MVIRRFTTYLLPLGEADLDDRIKAILFCTNKAELFLSRYILPEAPDVQTMNTWMALSQLKPDSCIGYVSRSDASATGVDSATTCEEESIFCIVCKCSCLLLPSRTNRSRLNASGATSSATMS
jgi:hypothetical protein